jgi:very-short-patch-repair endonuclease
MIDEETKKDIKKDYENGLSIGKICKKYNISSKGYISNYVLSGKTRSLSESIKLAHKKYSESFKHTDETKKKMREKRLAWMKANPEKTAWRLKNMSYPEKCFQKILEDNGLDKKYLIYREYSVFPYFIDFAFVNEKIAVEIDGSQHLKEDRKKRDEEKDKLLISNGWKVLRIAAIEVIRDGTKALNAILELLMGSNKQYTKVGIFKAPKKYEKVIRGEDGLSDKERLRAFNQRKVERPNKEELSNLLQKSNFTAIGRSYGVSDNAVRWWCKYYGLPYRKKDIEKLKNL